MSPGTMSRAVSDGTCMGFLECRNIVMRYSEDSGLDFDYKTMTLNVGFMESVW
jgi:hypothetical protein